MYPIDFQHHLNSTPWKLSLQERLKLLHQYAESKFRVFIILYEFLDHSTFRYRAYNLHESLSGSSEWRCIYFFRDEIPHLYSYLNEIDVITVVRFKWTLGLDHFLRRARAKKIKIAFDIDDLVFDTTYIPLVTNSLDFVFKDETDYDAWFSLVSRVEYTAKIADCFTTTNDYLGRMLSKKYDKPYYVIPNYLNEAQIRMSHSCLEYKSEDNYRKPFTIGYFSGTPTHINDFRVVFRELVHLMTDYDGINLRVVGHLDFSSEMQPFIKSKRVEFIPLVDFIELQRLIAEVDVNIAPLHVNEFTNCKSELKYFEAAAVKTLTCATPTFAFQESIKNGVSGFLCREGEWYPKLSQIYLGQSGVNVMVENAYQQAMKWYTGTRIISQIEHCYHSILNGSV